MPRDAVSRTANVERNGGHQWVKINVQLTSRTASIRQHMPFITASFPVTNGHWFSLVTVFHLRPVTFMHLSCIFHASRAQDFFRNYSAYGLCTSRLQIVWVIGYSMLGVLKKRIKGCDYYIKITRVHASIISGLLSY